MKVLLINGSPHEHGCIYTSLSEVKKSLEANGVEGEIFWLGSQAIQDCTGCNACSRLGRCMYDDCVNEVYDRLDEFQGIVVGSPVYYSGVNGALCALPVRSKSGLITALAGADGWFCIPRDREGVPAGEQIDVYLYD